MEAAEIRKKFLEFFKARGHAEVLSSSLIPDDPSVLLTTAGMQQFKKYYTGEADPIKYFGSKNTTSIQKSFRTSDIDEVGDETHNTFFEMLGNFSFGGYFKKEAITFAFEFIAQEMKLEISHVTVFRGSHGVEKDEASVAIWKSLGVADVREEGIEEVFWGPTGSSGPCGPTTEIYCAGVKPEIWNVVFNEFYFPGSREELLSGISGKSLEKLKTPGVDTGMGLERLTMAVQKKENIFETDLFAPFMELLPAGVNLRHKRIIVDHLRGSAFLLADGVGPSNKGAVYILRRLIRRALVYEKLYAIPDHVFDSMIHDIIHEYGEFYPELLSGNQIIRDEFKKEKERFSKTLERGIKELHSPGVVLNAAGSFKIYETFGLPLEIIKELGGENAKNLTREAFDEEFKKHQEISRAGQEKKFGGHGLLLDTGELKAADERELKIVTRLHTATHLLNAALHKVLGDVVVQNGSDITAERTRFDFNFARKLTAAEIKKIEDMVNYAIEKDFPVTMQALPLAEAKKTGALFVGRSKYPDPVKVYTAGNEKEVLSKELCGGPHVSRTGEIGRFRITKEESSSAGVRRIRAVVE